MEKKQTRQTYILTSNLCSVLFTISKSTVCQDQWYRLKNTIPWQDKDGHLQICWAITEMSWIGYVCMFALHLYSVYHAFPMLLQRTCCKLSLFLLALAQYINSLPMLLQRTCCMISLFLLTTTHVSSVRDIWVILVFASFHWNIHCFLSSVSRSLRTNQKEINGPFNCFPWQSL